MAGGIKRIGNGSSRARGIKTGVDNTPNRLGYLKINNLQLPTMVDWTAYTPTGPWSNTTYTGYWMRMGNRLIGRIGLQLTGAPSGTLSFTQAQLLPVVNGSQLLLNTAAFPGYGTAAGSNYDQVIGHMIINDNGTGEFLGLIYWDGASNIFRVKTANGTSIAPAVTATSPMTFAANDHIVINIDVPIQGWDVNGTGTIEEAIGSSFFDINGKVPYVATVFQGAAAIANDTFTDFASNLNLTVPAGRYQLEWGCTFRIDDSTAPTHVRCIAQLTNSGGTALTTQDSGSTNGARSWIPGISNGITRFQSAYCSQICTFTSQQFMKLQVSLNVVGGATINREVFSGYIIATPLDD